MPVSRLALVACSFLVVEKSNPRGGTLRTCPRRASGWNIFRSTYCVAFMSVPIWNANKQFLRISPNSRRSTFILTLCNIDERRQMRRASVRGGARTPMTEPSIWYMSRRRIYKDERGIIAASPPSKIFSLVAYCYNLSSLLFESILFRLGYIGNRTCRCDSRFSRLSSVAA